MLNTTIFVNILTQKGVCKLSVIHKNDVLIIGGGAAGVGVATVLKRMNIDCVILEKDQIGSTFKKWPKETQFISPSFTGNFFKMPDLNAITPETSPAFNLLTEHPTGEEYQVYLKSIAEHYELSIELGVTVESVQKTKNHFVSDR